jgi:DNA invertase Pin-like site-specific DNA recombinase
VVKRVCLYLRVSTARQGASGLGLEAQREAIRQFIGDATIISEHQEVESAGRSDRPALSAALRDCRVHNATLVIAKLDRLARNVAFVSALMESGVPFVAVDNPHATPFTIHILAAVAELEAKAISERTKAALAAAKARGTRLGGRRAGHRIEDQAQAASLRSAMARGARADSLAQDRMEIIRAIRDQGVTTLRGLARAMNDRGVPAPRGGLWSAGQVSRVLDRVAG